MKRVAMYFLLGAVTWMMQPQQAAAQIVIRLLPLQVFSEEPDTEDLRVLLERIMAARLMGESDISVVYDPQETPPAQGYTQDQARQLALDAGARWVLWGSLTQAGKLLSMDFRLMDIQEMEEPLPLYAQALERDELIALAEQEIERALTEILELNPIVEIRVEGNRRIGKDAIMLRTKTRVGDGYSPYRLREDIREIEKLGYFEDVQVHAEDVPKGKVVVFTVREKPTVREVLVTGNEKMGTEDIKEVITLQPQSILNYEVLGDTVEKIKKLYQEEGFYGAEVSYELKDLEGDQKGVVFKIEEGEKFWIKTITFEGNENISDKELKGVMETREKDWLHWLTGSGVLDQEALRQDVERLSAYYYNHGFLKNRIATPRIESDDEWTYITIGVEEGDPYSIRTISLKGNLLEEEEVMKDRLRVKEGQPFNRDLLRKEILRLTDQYADQGYAYADINPEWEVDEDEKTVDITLRIQQNQKVYIGRVSIVGNTKTRDKVIRRELLLSEGDTFSSTALKLCAERLRELKYFEEVNVTTTPGASEDVVDLVVEVKEKQTGTFSLGGGYSTVDQLVGIAEIQQTNLFGRGYKVRLKAEVGTKRQFYDFGIADPWFLDSRWSMRLDLYNLERDYIDYTRAALGGDIFFARPMQFIDPRLTGVLGYRGEEIEVKDVDPRAAEIFQLQKGKFFNSQVIGALSWDGRDNEIYPSKGNFTELTGIFAGLGGDSKYYKAILSSAWYFPVIWGTVFMARGEIGVGKGWGGEELPVYERFFLGGLNSMRGFEAGSVGPRDPRTQDVVGGDKEIFFNFEYIFPILKKLELRGLIFYDTGNAYLGPIDVADFRHAVGSGIRWYSPFGPIRVEIGYNLDPLSDEDDYEWAFGMGGSF